MEEIVKVEMTKAEAEQLSELITECVEKIKQAREQMTRDQVEIEQLRAETRAVIARLGRKAA